MRHYRNLFLFLKVSTAVVASLAKSKNRENSLSFLIRGLQNMVCIIATVVPDCYERDGIFLQIFQISELAILGQNSGTRWYNR